MVNDWKDVSLGDIFNVKHGFAFKGEYFVDEPTETILVTPGNFAIGGGFQNLKPKYYNGPIPEDYVLKPGQVLITMTDLSKQSDTLGYPALVPNDGNIWLHNQRVGLLEFKEEYSCSPNFINYLLRTHDYRSWIIGSATGTTVKHTSPNRIHDYRCKLPPIYEQKAIAHVLGTLDDRIELNRQMNETLEAMAQALFKSWFVDFDPVIDNALANVKEIPEELSEKAQVRAALGDKYRLLPEDIRNLFPDELTFIEELGWIPNEWEIKEIGELIELAYGKSLPSKQREAGPYPVYGSGGIGGVHKKALVEGPGIIVGRKGTVGSVYWENGDFFPIDTVFFVKPKIELPMYWLYQNLKNMDIASLGADSAVPGVNRNSVYFKKWVVPNSAILKKFWDMISDLIKKRRILEWNNDTLAKLRDTLLPKLLSGEIRIPDAEKLIERVDG